MTDVRLLRATDIHYPLEAFGTTIPSKDQVEDPDLSPEPLPDDFLPNLPGHLRTRIVAPPQGDRSKNDYSVCRSLLSRGLTPGQILSVLLTEEWAISAKTSERGIDYALRTIRSAQVGREEQEDKPLYAVLEESHWLDTEKGPKRVKEVDPVEEFTRPALEWLRKHGTDFIRDRATGDGYVFADGILLAADKEDRALKDYVYRTARAVESDWNSRKLREAIAHESRANGREADLHQWITFNESECTGYILPDAHRGSMLTFGGPRLEFLPNGTDGFLLKSSALSDPLSLDLKADKTQGLRKLVKTLTPNFACAKAGQQILTAYLLALVLQRYANNDLLPILHVTGPSGAGKSWALKLMTAWMYGKPTLLQATQASSYVLSDSDLFLPLDDFESLSPDWQQRLLTGATGQTRTKMDSSNLRAVFQQGTVSFAITSITPLPTETLRRRAMVVEVDSKKYSNKGFSAINAVPALVKVRDETWSAYLRLLHEDILPAMRAGSSATNVRAIEATIKVEQNRNLATFLSLMWLVASHLSKYTGEDFQVDDLETTMKSWGETLALGSEQEYQERDHLLFCIDALYDELFRAAGEYTMLRGIDVKPIIDNGTLRGFRGTGGELHGSFSTVCKNRGLRYELTSPNSVGRRFQLTGEQLARSGYDVHAIRVGPRHGWEVVKK